MTTKISIILFFQIVFTHTIFANELISQEEFTNQFVLTLTKNKDVDIIKTSPLKVIFKIKTSQEQESYLDNAYIEYKNDPSIKNEILERYSTSAINSILTMETEFPKESILPIIKDNTYIRQIRDLMEEKNNLKDFPLVYEKINNILYIVYAFDTPKNIRFMDNSDLKRLKINKNNLKEIALNNLLNLLPAIKTQGNPAGLSILVADGNYEASLLLVDDLWDKTNFPVKGDIVVYIPSRDTVLVTGSEDEDSLKKIHEIIYSPKAEWPHMVSEVGFIRKGNTWKEFRKN